MLLPLWLISIHFSAYSSSTLVLVFDFYTYSELDIKIMGSGAMLDINSKIIKVLSHGINHSKTIIVELSGPIELFMYDLFDNQF